MGWAGIYWIRDFIMKIGVISDTHARHYSQLPQNLLKALEKVDLIVHAGDIVTMDVIRGLETVAPVKGVCGNMDLPEVRLAFPEKLLIELGGRKIGVMHGSGGPAGLENLVTQAFDGVDIIIFGHSHIAVNKVLDGINLFNPGSAGNSYGVLELGERVSGKIIRDYF
jgi:putative phosphoesterase